MFHIYETYHSAAPGRQMTWQILPVASLFLNKQRSEKNINFFGIFPFVKYKLMTENMPIKSLVCVCVRLHAGLPHCDFETANRSAWNLVWILTPHKFNLIFTYSLTVSNRNMAGARIQMLDDCEFYDFYYRTPPPFPLHRSPKSTLFVYR